MFEHFRYNCCEAYWSIIKLLQWSNQVPIETVGIQLSTLTLSIEVKHREMKVVKTAVHSILWSIATDVRVLTLLLRFPNLLWDRAPLVECSTPDPKGAGSNLTRGCRGASLCP